ncbi:MAG: response regulator [Treponema sp.]|nr:response regulator [Treponema sp.]
MDANARKKQVLIINAAPMFREFVKEKLSSENVIVEMADGRLDSFSKMIRIIPDLVIIDVEDSFEEIMDLLERKMSDPNAKRIPVIISGPEMERAQISSLVQYGVVKYFSKPIKFDVFFEAIGKIIRVNLSMDTTPCVLEIHHNGNVVFVEIAQGLNREKISLLKYKIKEMIDNYKIREPKLIVMMTNLQLSFVDGINVELLLDTVTADERIQKRNIKILSLDNYMSEFIDGHVEYVGVRVLKDLTSALGSIVGSAQANGDAAEIIADSILTGDDDDATGSVDIRFGAELGDGESKSTEGNLLNIAIVDDDEVVRKILTQAFQSVGIATEAFESGAKFAQALLIRTFDLAVLDIFMQGVSGFDILNQLRSKEKPVPVIVYSQAVQREYVIQALSLGAKGYLAKPQKPEVIIKKAMEILHDRI